MLNYNIAYDPYDGSNKKQHLLELVMLLRRALTLKALYEKMVAIVTLTYKKIIPNLIPGITYYIIRRYVLQIDLLELIDRKALTLRYGYKICTIIEITIITIIGLGEMIATGIAVISQQYVFWWLFQRKHTLDDKNPPDRKPPRRRNIQYP